MFTCLFLRLVAHRATLLDRSQYVATNFRNSNTCQREKIILHEVRFNLHEVRLNIRKLRTLELEVF